MLTSSETDRLWIQHLYHRLGFGASSTAIQQAIGMTTNALVDQLLNTAAASNHFDPSIFPWYLSSNEGHNTFLHLRNEYITGLLKEPIVNKIVLFWHNHLVATFGGQGHHEVQYLRLLYRHSLGNFKQMVMDIGLSPLMLFYLNGSHNTVSSPNENYARELLELFTMGEYYPPDGSSNYSQQDIEEIARALTGYIYQIPLLHYYDGLDSLQVPTDYYDPNGPQNYPKIRVNHALKDWGSKTIFGQVLDYLPGEYTQPYDIPAFMETAVNEYKRLHDIIFEQRGSQIAYFICAKIYRHFVNQTEDPAIIQQLAQIFQANGFELLPVFKQLFKSEHFFSEGHIGAQIKSPAHFFSSYYQHAGFIFNEDWFNTAWAVNPNYDPNDPYANDILSNPTGDETYNHAYHISTYTVLTGQRIFIPPNVAGWPGHHVWINEQHYVNRRKKLEEHLRHHFNGGGHYPYDTQARFLALIRQLTLEDNNQASLSLYEPEKIVRAVLKHFIICEDMEIAVEPLTFALQHHFPDNYYSPYTPIEYRWHLDRADEMGQPPGITKADIYKQIKDLMTALVQLPEFNLC